ncbi:GNAT family N-acetyltransferase [Vagococcus sp. BWB3-3]|uniref:GNAT family N-acetyltransferase n=1 Tax=Vagococcus allomyrinae TaxID=2794353 RepID=A0A940PDJ8_9ENTE|nr:GNAT family N-acetyltransferase [Vagococcus allomyrinae]MBP1042850.1 GNAT family N-acetyltransferase [Vagococcus allomyrinae]
MENMTLLPYIAKRDRTLLEKLLVGHHYYSTMFKESADNGQCIWVVYLKTQLTGVLFHDGLQRGTELTIFVDPAYRNRGIGTYLLSLADQMFRENESVERAKCAYLDQDNTSRSFLLAANYQRDYAMFLMERDTQLLPIKESLAEIRPYHDNDYLIFQSLLESVFYKLRQRLGYPLWYREASERDRRRFLADKGNRYVMLVKGEIIAVGVLFDNILEAIAVKPAFQNQGFGSIFISFLVNKLIARGAEKVQLWVDDGNEAKQLYELLGFNQLALYHFYYRRYRPETRPIGPPPELDELNALINH